MQPIVFMIMLFLCFAAIGFLLWKLVGLRAQLTESWARERLLEERMKDRKENEEILRAAARTEIAAVAGQLFEKESRRMFEASEKSLDGILSPLKERLKDFEKKVDETYQTEGRERFLLKSEVEKLILLNEKMTRETTQLTQALKGDSKFQGDWGEFVLENILASSGLREGLEFTKQESFENNEGEKLRPDIVIKLPDDKQIIIDSKVSLKAYEACMRSEVPEERARQLRLHCESLSKHVESLADKHYPKVKGMRTPEFVFLFTPIESAYVMAIQHDPELAMKAWRRGVAIVTSTTLFTSLKTVASIWRLENQNRNAQEIADEAAKLYDKFVGFHEDFEKIGRIFDSGVTQYDEARRKLRDGPGNVFRKIELLRELGAAPNKRIKPELLE